MSVRYLLRRGKGSLRRVVHLTTFDPISGEPTMTPLCGRWRSLRHHVERPVGSPDVQALPKGSRGEV